VPSYHPARVPGVGAAGVDHRPHRIRPAAQRRQVAIGVGRPLLGHLGAGARQCLLMQPIVRCWMGPWVESSQACSMLWAGAPQWGVGMVSGMGCAPTLPLGAVVDPWRRLRYQRGCAVQGWASSAARHLTGVPRVTLAAVHAAGDLEGLTNPEVSVQARALCGRRRRLRSRTPPTRRASGASAHPKGTMNPGSSWAPSSPCCSRSPADHSPWREVVPTATTTATRCASFM
jgi:hypothetical protein